MSIQKFLNKINNKTANISIIGLGYVGLPLAIKFINAGFDVYGIDNDKSKVASIKKGKSLIEDISDSELSSAIKSKKLRVSTRYSDIKKTSVVIICVPTPLSEYKTPDISYIIDSTKSIKENLLEGQLIILESTTYPGTTEEEVLPLLETNKFKVGKDFFLSYSPERVDPGNKNFDISEIPKIVSGVTKNCLLASESVYKKIFKTIFKVSSTKVAESAKLLENIHRAVNIALVNEMKVILDRMEIDIWEVIDAASTKPFGFTPYYPGPGLGGHCIPIDPFYLSWKAKEVDTTTRFIELAGEINRNMPYRVVTKIGEALNSVGKTFRNSKVLILGVAYKKDINDFRESPALKIMCLLKEKGASFNYNDNYIKHLQTTWGKDEIDLKSWKLDYAKLNKFDCTLIVTDHSYYDWNKIVQQSNTVVDTRNATKHISKHRKKIFKA